MPSDEGHSPSAASSATAAQKTGRCKLWRSTTPRGRRRRCLAARRRRSWVAASTAAALARPDAHPAAAACRARCWAVAAPCCGQPVRPALQQVVVSRLAAAVLSLHSWRVLRLVVGWRQVPVAWVHKGAVRNSKQAHRSPPAVVQVQTNRYEVCRNTEVIISL